MLVKVLYKILKKVVDNCDKFYLEETDPDVMEAKELLGRMEKVMKEDGESRNNFCGECGCKFDWSDIDE